MASLWIIWRCPPPVRSLSLMRRGLLCCVDFFTCLDSSHACFYADLNFSAEGKPGRRVERQGNLLKHMVRSYRLPMQFSCISSPALIIS